MTKSNSDKDILEGEEGFSSPSEDVYSDATVKISRDQYSIFEIRQMLKGIYKYYRTIKGAIVISYSGSLSERSRRSSIACMSLRPIFTPFA